ncbi:hypothetical protein PFLUV_G00160420 [Perca fluviatilis]|uniref:Ig-like domain-containing protein n=1 Tax=Perca fluviatilis TaxID=8168 RepID=A0A6A5F0I6_PERFL|nr:hypothetical protein PFLUV_G00160420 [Perca fluviatilis]
MSSMMISPLQKEDNGEYRCQLTNPIDKAEAFYKMVVNFGPEKAEVKGKKAVEVNNKVDLTCFADSIPRANFTWKFNGTDTGVKTNYFMIEMATAKDIGMYTCEANNAVTGMTATYTHSLNVKGKIHVCRLETLTSFLNHCHPHQTHIVISKHNVLLANDSKNRKRNVAGRSRRSLRRSHRWNRHRRPRRPCRRHRPDRVLQAESTGRVTVLKKSPRTLLEKPARTNPTVLFPTIHLCSPRRRSVRSDPARFSGEALAKTRFPHHPSLSLYLADEGRGNIGRTQTMDPIRVWIITWNLHLSSSNLRVLFFLELFSTFSLAINSSAITGSSPALLFFSYDLVLTNVILHLFLSRSPLPLGNQKRRAAPRQRRFLH